MLPIILTKPSHVLVVGAGKAAAYKFKTLGESGVRISCLAQEFITVPEDGKIETITGNFYTADESLFEGFDLIYLAIPYPEEAELAEVYQARVARLISLGKLVNACARPGLGNFIHPATRRVDNLIVSVSTSGKNPKQAVEIAERFKKELEHESGA